MIAEQLAPRVVDCLRRTALAGSTRPVALDEPLTEMGLGLDSLALVGFFVALEKEFSVELMESDWLEREELTLAALIEHIAAQAPQPAMATPTPPRARNGEAAPRGLRRLARSGLERIYAEERFRVLARSLTGRALPPVQAPPGIAVRQAGLADLEDIGSLYQGEVRQRKVEKARRWFGMGFFCFLADADGRTVGIDWLATADHRDAMTGLILHSGGGVCFGVDLYELPSHAGRGVGVSLLLRSLHAARDLGFRRQLTVVSEHNTAMLAASVQLLGFERVGQVRTQRWLRRPRSQWELGEQRGRGGHFPAREQR